MAWRYCPFMERFSDYRGRSEAGQIRPDRSAAHFELGLFLFSYGQVEPQIAGELSRQAHPVPLAFGLAHAQNHRDFLVS